MGGEDKNKQELQEFQSRVMFVSEDPAGTVMKLKDITEYLYQLDENGKIKKGEDSKFLKTENSIIVSEIREPILPYSPGKGGSVSVYRASIIDKDGKVVNDKEGKPLTFATGLQNKEYIRIYDEVPVIDGKLPLDKLYLDIQAGSQRCQHQIEIDSVGSEIEMLKKQNKSEKSAAAIINFDEKPHYKTKLRTWQTIAAGVGPAIMLGGMAQEAGSNKDNEGMGNTFSGIIVTAITVPAVLSIPGKKVGTNPDLRPEFSIPIINQENAPVENKLNVESFQESYSGVQEYGKSDILKTIKKSLKKGKADDMLIDGSELSQKLDKIAKENDLSFNKIEVKELLERVKKLAEDGLTYDKKNTLAELVEKFGITDGGTVVPGTMGTKTKAGWMVE